MLGSLIVFACLASLCKNTVVVSSKNVASADTQVFSKIAAAHFAHRYHHWNLSTLENKPKKHRRAVGKKLKKFSGDLGEAVLTGLFEGIIGAVKYQNFVDLISNYFEPTIEDSCAWFGTAPLCHGECRKNFEYIRSHNGLCSTHAGSCIPDRTFGEPCLQRNYKKVYCCRHTPSDCLWDGYWINSSNAEKYYCTFHSTPGTCGHLKCFLPKGSSDKVPIEGEHCDTITIFGRPGLATCGFIAFYENHNYTDVTELWYKTPKVH